MPLPDSKIANPTPEKSRFRAFWKFGSGWIFSLWVHVAMFGLFGFWFLPQLPISLTAGLDVSIDEPMEDQLEESVEFETEEIDLNEGIEIVEQTDTTLVEQAIDFSSANDLSAEAAPEVSLLEIGTELAPLMTSADASGVGGNGLAGRGSMARAAMLRKGGGNPASEAAVGKALAWLVEHQNRNGSWSFDHRFGTCQGRCGEAGSLDNALAGGTAIALLPFLGAGHTHQSGKYQVVVQRGLNALVRMMEAKSGGGSFMDGGNMYSQGLAAIALCEAYGMTDDPKLQRPAQMAIDFICYTQDPRGGGWRYRPRTTGDTSVVGWQVLALKSGHMSYLRVPSSVVHGASLFLDSVATDQGTGYAYTGGNLDYRKSTSAIGLLCRMYLGWNRQNEILARGVERVAQTGPSKTDFYFNYYAAQLLFQFTGGEGPLWGKWNEQLRDQLVDTQSTQGHELGSWITKESHAVDRGGRHYCTAIACMTLEVYYRHMPIYRTEAVETEFPE